MSDPDLTVDVPATDPMLGPSMYHM